MTLGMHKRGQYMTILNVDECQLVHEDFNVIVRAVLDFCRQRGVPALSQKEARRPDAESDYPQK